MRGVGSEGPLDRADEARVCLELRWNGVSAPRLVSPGVVGRAGEVVDDRVKSANSEVSCRQFGDVWLLPIHLGGWLATKKKNMKMKKRESTGILSVDTWRQFRDARGATCLRVSSKLGYVGN